MALDWEMKNSETVSRCHACLNGLAEQHRVLIIWVPAHSNVEDNWICQIWHNHLPLDVGIPLRTCGYIIDSAILNSINNRKAAGSGQSWIKHVPLICLDSKEARSENLLEFTEHCIIGTHVKRIGLGHLMNDFFRRCIDDK